MDRTEALAQLRDIRGLDVAGTWSTWSAWSPWVLTLIAVIVIIILLWCWQRLSMRQNWRADARRQLLNLRKRLKYDDPKELVSEFSMLLRRICMARCGRQTCAGLGGEAWLDWLQQNDPNAFSWRQHGSIIIHAPYAPPQMPVDNTQLQKLLKVALTWVKTPDLKDKHNQRWWLFFANKEQPKV